MNRIGFIGGSDAKRILDGDWHHLYLEKTGQKEPEDLSHSFQVQLGLLTERFHIGWLNKYCGFDIRGSGGLSMKGHPQLQAQLDGWCHVNGCFVEIKHSSGRASRDQMIDWYQPQIAHYCNVANVDCGILSYIAGNSPPDWFRMAPSKEYRDALLELELAFWWHVENREMPLALPDGRSAVKELAAKVAIDDMRSVDMTGNNQWAQHAIDYSLNLGAAQLFENAKKGLKELVEADVRLASGHGVQVKRSKSGALLFSELRP